MSPTCPPKHLYKYFKYEDPLHRILLYCSRELNTELPLSIIPVKQQQEIFPLYAAGTVNIKK